jgi:hypothetical protein
MFHCITAHGQLLQWNIKQYFKSITLENLNSLQYVTMCRMPQYCSTKRQMIDYCSKSKMDCKVLTGLCGLVHSYL